MRNGHGTIYVGIDVSKDKLAVAIAGGERGDEVLSLGTFENTPATVDKLLKKLACCATIRMRFVLPHRKKFPSDQTIASADCSRVSAS